MIYVRCEFAGDADGPKGKSFRIMELPDFDTFEDFLDAWRDGEAISGNWVFCHWRGHPSDGISVIHHRRPIGFWASEARTVEQCTQTFVEDE